MCSAQCSSQSTLMYIISSNLLLTTSLEGRRCYLYFTLEETEAQKGETSCGSSLQGTWQSRDLNPSCFNHEDRVCPTVYHGRLRELFRSWHQTQGNHLHVCSISLIHRGKTQSLVSSAWAGVEILFTYGHPSAQLASLP